MTQSFTLRTVSICTLDRSRIELCCLLGLEVRGSRMDVQDTIGYGGGSTWLCAGCSCLDFATRDVSRAADG